MTTTTRWRRRALIGLAGAGLALLASCSSSAAKPGAGAASTSSAASSVAGTGSTPASSGSSSTTGGSSVTVKNFSFNPMTLTVPVGTTVTWTFEDSAKHTVSATDKSFGSTALNDGQTYKHTFNTAGTYSYICSIHQYMTGTVIVK